MRQSKLPPNWPTFVIKCTWDSTATLVKVVAKDEMSALDRVWKQMRKTEGGDKCVSITVKEVRWNL